MKKALFLTVFNPEFESDLLNSDISITSYNFFKIIFQGFISNNYNCDFITTHHYENVTLKKSNFMKIISQIQDFKINTFDILIVDSTVFPFTIIGFFLQFFLKAKVVLFLTDLPIYKKIGFFKYLLHNFFINLYFKKVYLTNYMKQKYLNFTSTIIPFILPIECNISISSDQKVFKNYFYYAGSLDEINNIDKMILSFLNLNNKNILLLIAGSGSNLESLKKKFNYSKVVFLGQIQPEYSRKLMRNALLLLSFRDNFSKITKYSFPFKLMDYINSMTPIFTSRIDSFDSIPYIKNYFYTFESSYSTIQISKSLDNVLKKRVYYLKKSYYLYKKLFLKFNSYKVVNDIITL